MNISEKHKEFSKAIENYFDGKISQEWVYYKSHPIRRKEISNRLKQAKRRQNHDNYTKI